MTPTNLNTIKPVTAILYMGIFAVLAFLVGEDALNGLLKWRQINSDRIDVQGRIVQVKRPHLKGQFLRYEYSMGSKVYYGSESGDHYDGPLKVGERVTVTLSQRNPTASTLDLAYIERNTVNSFGLMLVCLAACILYAIGLLKIYNSRRNLPHS